MNSIIQKLQISPAEEDCILRAEATIRGVLAPSLTRIDFELVVDPVVSALQSLRNSLAIISDASDISLSKQDWDRIKINHGIIQQTKKINSLASSFCSSMDILFEVIFTVILRHKSLNDASKSNGILVKRFSFSESFNDAIAFKTNKQSVAKLGKTSNNQLLNAQRCYHEVVCSLFPLIEQVLGLKADFAAKIRSGYVKSTQELLYTPLIKQLFKEVMSFVVSSQVVSFPTMPKVRYSKSESTLLASNLAAPAGKPGVYIWDALLSICLLVAPVLNREEAFLMV